MATLSKKTSDGTPAFTKYVTENPRLAYIMFRIENGMTSEILKEVKEKTYKSVKNIKLTSSTEFKIKPESIKIAGIEHAKIQYRNIEGYIPLNKIRKPTADVTLHEKNLVEDLNALITQNGSNLTLKIGNKFYKNINYATRVDGRSIGILYGKDPKADIVLHVEKNKPIADTSVYISYKTGTTAQHFHQYGGLSSSAQGGINQDKEVQEFLGQVSSLLDKKMFNSSISKPIKSNDIELKSKAVFGPESMSSKHSLQNVHLVAQGKPSISRDLELNNFFILKFEQMFFTVSDLPNGYTPVLGAIPTSDVNRGFSYNGKRYNKVRVGIYPEDYFKNRTCVNNLDTLKD
jgi:hypothetical protein